MESEHSFIFNDLKVLSCPSSGCHSDSAYWKDIFTRTSREFSIR